MEYKNFQSTLKTIIIYLYKNYLSVELMQEE